MTFQDKTVRLWNIETSDDIPVVLEHRKNIGLRIIQVHCTIITNINIWDDLEFNISFCLFALFFSVAQKHEFQPGLYIYCIVLT